MTWLQVLLSRFLALFRNRRLERDLDDEVRSHLEMLVEENQRKGIPPEEAHYAALRSFGSVERVKEAHRDQRGLPLIETVWQDLRHGVRMLAKNPGFTVVAVLTLALGIGVNATFFSAVNALFLRPPANVQTPDKLVSLYQTVPGGGAGDFFLVWAYPDYVYYRDYNEVLSALAAYSPAPLNLGVEGSNEKVFGDLVSGNYFAALGTKPFLGRFFVPEEDDIPGAPLVAVVSYEFWQGRFGGDLSVVGKTVTINRWPFTVIGVTPKGMVDLGLQTAPTVWVPLAAQAYADWPPGDANALKDRGTGWLTVLGRLRQNVRHQQALLNLDLVARQLARDHPDPGRGHGIAIEPATSLPPFIRGAAIGFVILLQVLGGLLLLIPCANVGGLMLARAGARRNEITIRCAVGASRWRIVRQLLTENLLIALCGAVAGLLLALLGADALIRLKPPIDIPIAITLRPDFRILGFTLAVAFISAALFGLAPALHLSSASLTPHLVGRTDSGSPGGSKTQRMLVVVQVSISLLLLIGAGLCVRSLRNAEQINPGFETRNIASFSVSPTLGGYSHAKAAVFCDQLWARLHSIRGVQSISLAVLMPLSYGQLEEMVGLEISSAAPSQQIPVGENLVGPGYFETIGIPILRGRGFLRGENDKDRVVINETLARRLFPGQDPIGRRLKVGGGGHPRSVEIVGVARDSKYRTLGEPPKPFFYEALTPGFDGPGGITVLMRTSVAPQSLASAMRNQVATLDKSLPVSPVETMEEHIRSALWLARTTVALLGVLGVLGTFLAMIGLFGTVAYSVGRRTNEIGVRMALGARPAEILRMAMTEGLSLTLAGVGVGMAFALLLTRFLGSLLYGVSATDPSAFSLVPILFVLAALAACYFPARRATKVDPMVALRYE